jgi:redox-sensing transcriptional repressor
VSSPRSSRNGAPEGRAPRPSSPRLGDRGIPEATVARLPIYLRALVNLSERAIATCSSEELAAAAGVNSAKLRKDLSYLGSYGTRGVGYDVEYLRYQIAREIGLTQDWPVVIVGIGNLGHALANYSGFSSRGFRIVALLDSDPARVGEEVGTLSIRPFDEIESLVADHDVAIGVVATPASSAQEVCDRLVGAGVTSILNFAPAVLAVPDGVDVRKVDLSIELQILAYHEQRKALHDGRPGARVTGAELPGGLPGRLPGESPGEAGSELSNELGSEVVT